MRIAFYAPLKSPTHGTPSGDRRVAGLLMDALAAAGHRVQVASTFRSYDGDGDEARQRALRSQGEAYASQLADDWRAAPAADRPELWFTFHLYYKAPDWLGPLVSAALGIPYIVAEASHAAKRAGGPWALGHVTVARAIRRADAVIGLNSADRAGIVALLGNSKRWFAMPPFLDAAAYPAIRPEPEYPPRLIAVAMMRPGDKLASYRLLAAALASLLDLSWTLEVVGDGPVRNEVKQALAPLGYRVRYAGALDPTAAAAHLARADLCVWPAINEAFGMALLEAQACGVP